MKNRVRFFFLFLGLLGALCLIIRKDGGTLYATRDITAAIYRKKTYNFDKCIYLTALDQNLHFAQWFKVIEKMGYEWSGDLAHVPFGLVSLDSFLPR